MATYLLMCALLLVYAAITLYGVKYDDHKESFLTEGDACFLRGVWCVIVVLVHTPAAYQNRLQDLLGSFAYVGVTFFFLTSSYGLKCSMAHKDGYMDHFWKRRLSALLIPAIPANAYVVLCRAANGQQSATLRAFLNIDGWVKVLIFLYFTLWFVYMVTAKLDKSGGVFSDRLIVILIIAYSLYGQFSGTHFLGWNVELLGFAYGIIAANHADSIRTWLQKRWHIKTLTLMILSGVLGVSYLRYKFVSFWGNYVLRIALGIAILAFMFALLSRFRVGNKAIHFLGSISYELYVLHRGSFALLMRIGEAMNSGLFICLTFALTILLAIGLKWITDHIIKLFAKTGICRS